MNSTFFFNPSVPWWGWWCFFFNSTTYRTEKKIFKKFCHPAFQVSVALPVLLYGTLIKFLLIIYEIYTFLGDHWEWWKSVCQLIHIHANTCNWGLLKVATCNNKDKSLFTCGLMSDMLICMEYIAWAFMTPNVFPEKQHSPNSPWLLSVLFPISSFR